MLATTDIARAVEQATRAPSVHNTQPWHWRIGPDEIELHADIDRHLPATDPDRRDLVLSCGIALQHLLVALAALGLRTETLRFPDREEDTLGQAAAEQERQPAYPAELRAWTHRYAAGRDGVPADHLTAAVGPCTGPTPLRRFTRGTMRDITSRPPAAGDAAELLVITTPADEPVDRLQAGEAAGAVLLTATGLGLATTPLSQAVEVETSRMALARDVLGVRDEPQLIIRVGWPATGAPPLPATPRRPLRSVLLPPHSPLPVYAPRETR